MSLHSPFAVGPDTVRFALEASGQAMFEFDPAKGEVSWADPQQAGDLLGKEGPATSSCYDQLLSMITPESAAARAAEVEAAKRDGRSYTTEFTVTEISGRRRWFEERGTWMKIGDRTLMVGVLRRIDAQKEREAQLTYMAGHDEMTGMLNRARMKNALENALDTVGDGEGSAFYLVGIDNVGGINVSFGFEAADEVISSVAKRFESVLSSDVVCGRVAGTKFGILARGRSPEIIRARAIELLNAVRQDVIQTRSGSIAASVCIGVVPLGAEQGSADAAMAQAEAALDQARQSGPASWSLFSDHTDPVSTRHRDSEMSDTILSALNDRRVSIAFQPIVRDTDSPWKKHECLIRLDSEDGEEIAAPNFVASAERLGLIHLLDRRVLELACRALTREPEIELAVNVSWETVKDPVWADGYIGHLRANAHVAERLTIELTETRIVDAIEASEEFVARIKGLGAKFALDDFGAGYTSFRNLKALDIDILKIDGSFITGLAQSRENQLFVRTLVDLARNFEMQTVAEWVDNEQDARILKALGVDYLQGFFISKPTRRPEWTEREEVLAQSTEAMKRPAL
ncbi:EAL domain-containing protein [Parvularcula maris]|uniref:EAL domain-containing protein n=1 Tax=Parvularcula maris TaxID=2965077 RepID=A0A9X2L6W2_9PROT|nr:GGDEF domain-containing phosphodiesterase [Parvularcula maris]MCQ8184044.1 EAL domain-containing protein [Parvularcula maris]